MAFLRFRHPLSTFNLAHSSLHGVELNGQGLFHSSETRRLGVTSALMYQPQPAGEHLRGDAVLFDESALGGLNTATSSC